MRLRSTILTISNELLDLIRSDLDVATTLHLLLASRVSPSVHRHAAQHARAGLGRDPRLPPTGALPPGRVPNRPLDNDGRSIVHGAVSREDGEGGVLNARGVDGEGYTPLMSAVDRRDVAMARTLIGYRPDRGRDGAGVADDGGEGGRM